MSVYTKGSRVNPEIMADTLDALLVQVLPSISLANGRKPRLDECILHSVLLERGAYFPSIHWDSQWAVFPNADGFQLWYLLENDMVDEGNMFLVDTPHLFPDDDGPVRFIPTTGGVVRKLLHGRTVHEQVLEEYSVDEADLSFKYLDMQPGDCLVMSKRTLHMSDPRPHLRNEKVSRLALNVRVLVRPSDTNVIDIDPTCAACVQYYAYEQIGKRAVYSESNGKMQVAVGRHEMLFPDGRLLKA